MAPPLLEDMPLGPLTVYRKQASFDWKKMKFIFEDEELYKLKLKVWNTLQSEPIFDKTDTDLSNDELKRRAAFQFHKFCKYSFLPADINEYPYKEKVRMMMTLNEATVAFVADFSIKNAIGSYLITTALASMGTERHQNITKAIWNKKILAGVSLTEVAHGSNIKQMRTTATYDKNTQEFVIHTPDFEAAKCWVGNLGKTCVATLLFAQLYTQGQCYGLHAFMVPIRNPKTMIPYPGIIVGNMGEKIGLNGIDNGWLMFNNFRIPRENLLNRIGDVTPEGDYESSFAEPGRVLAAGLENLSAARVGIMQESINSLVIGVTIAIRYAGVRKQFGPTKEEIPILEYQLHQWRLFPHVAAAAVIRIFVNEFTNDYLNVITGKGAMTKLEEMSELVSEIHALVSAGKPLLTWTVIDAMQECREACGGHGYLAAARLGELRSNRDPSVTYEGDNNVLVQQTSNWLLQQWDRVLDNKPHTAHLGSAPFLANPRQVLSRKFAGTTLDSVLKYEFLTNAYEWLATFLLDITHKKKQELMSKGNCKFTARNNTQVYKAAVLSKVYGQYQVIRYFWRRVSKEKSEMRPVLENLGILYGLSCLDKHFAYFYQGGYAVGPTMVNLVKDGILELCARLKPEIMGVIDALAPPDEVHNSILGMADGKIYDHLQQHLFYNAETMTRPSWWHEILVEDVPDIRVISKL